MKLKDRIDKVKSSVRKEEMLKHQEVTDQHKKMLLQNSPSRAKLDPLVDKHLRTKVKKAALFNKFSLKFRV
jgi:hypothetical protein